MMAASIPASLMDNLPNVRGTLEEGASLAKYTWFRTGGPAEVLFRPKDVDDLQEFMANCPETVPKTVIGVGSNLIIRDGGIEGVVIKLGKAFSQIKVDENIVTAGAGAMDVTVATTAQKKGLTGLEFLRGIPGTIGGTVRMNGGAYGREISNCLKFAVLITSDGEFRKIPASDLGFTYRHSNIGEGCLVVEAIFECEKDDPKQIQARMDDIMAAREESQPLRTRTGGSTFKNPDPELSEGRKAWQLVDAAGCRGLQIGGAQVSPKHCNFLLNLGDATSKDIEDLGEEVRRQVLEKTGVVLEWEIRRIGLENGERG